MTTAKSIDREIEGRLSGSDIRYTRGRKRVVGALARSDGPMSASELHGQIGHVLPLSSLYRSLAVLERAGVLVHHFGAGGVTRYELSDWIQGHHHHLICVSCGKVEDLELPPGFERQVERLVRQIGLTHSFTPTDHALEIEGRCRECR